MSKVYLEVTNDEYELPVAVADSGTKLANLRGVDCRAVYNSIRLLQQGKIHRSKYVVVEVDDED